MAFPHHAHPETTASVSLSGSSTAANHGSGLRSAPPGPRCHLQGGPQIEGEHQLEKLEFALAVALTRGDQSRSQQLRDQIEALGGNREEPGT
jgi:hypothetical protein